MISMLRAWLWGWTSSILTLCVRAWSSGVLWSASLPVLITEQNRNLTSSSCLNHFHGRAFLVGRLAKILLEQYHTEGPVDLLAVVITLCRLRLHLIVISNASQISEAQSLLADALRADFQLNCNAAALQESIWRFRRAQSHLDLLSSSPHALQVGLAQALYCRFALFELRNDCEASLSLLAAHTSDSPQNENIQQARVLIVTVLIHYTLSVTRIVPRAAHNTLQTLTDLRNAQKAHLPRSLSLMSLVAEMRLLWELSYAHKNRDYAVDGIQLAYRALRTCPQNAAVLHLWMLWELFTLELAMVRNHWSDGYDHLDAAIAVAGKMQSSTLAQRNKMVSWDVLYLGNVVRLDRAMRADDLDLMESCVEAFRSAVITGPNKLRRRRAVNQLAYTLGVYFDQSGRHSCLDELIALLDLGDDYTVEAPNITSNIAEAMLIRARISNGVGSNALVHQALDLCQRRKNSETYAGAEKEEQANLNLQMITASQMLLNSDSSTFMTPDKIVLLAREGLEFSLQPSIRTGLVLAETGALIGLARVRRDHSFLSQAEQILEVEIAKDFMSSSVYLVELFAAQADLKIARLNILPDQDTSRLLPEAWDLYQSAVNHSIKSGHAKERYQVCLRWAMHATDKGHVSAAFRAYSCAVEVLPRVIFLGEDIVGRIEALRQVNGLASGCMATSLMLGDVNSAIQFLELTRGILWLQSLPTHLYHGETLPTGFKERFHVACSRLESAEERSWTVRRQAAEELGRVIEEIRTIPLFERFLLPPLLQDMVSALRVKNGLAVILSSTDQSCEVIVLGGSEGHSVLRLRTVNNRTVREMASQFVATCNSARTSQNRGIKPIAPRLAMSEDVVYLELLSSLWTSLVRPVLAETGVLQHALPLRTKRQRLWWCPVGGLSSLPLHAAGTYDGVSPEHVSSYVVSSYVPTLAALHRMLTGTGIDAGVPTGVTRSKVLLVAQPDSTGLPTLPQVQPELEHIRNIVPHDCILNHGKPEDMSVDDVLAQVPNANALHFACHADQDQDNPLNSGFSLKDGRLTLARLMRIKATHAELAYLSACQSAAVDEGRPDEGLNLAGTMISLGFKSVVATLWTMDDIDGPFMADRIYKQIFRDGTLNLTAVPHAVDGAVQALRESGVHASRWATYVHFGV